MLYAVSPLDRLPATSEPVKTLVRFRTVGDMTCTGAVALARGHPSTSCHRDRRNPDHRARRTRADDRVTEAAMEDRKREGYF